MELNVGMLRILHGVARATVGDILVRTGEVEPLEFEYHGKPRKLEVRYFRTVDHGRDLLVNGVERGSWQLKSFRLSKMKQIGV
jgi:hypothetical protein